MWLRCGHNSLSENLETSHPIVRRLCADDIDRLYTIETESYPFPWTRSIFVDCLRVGYACFGLQIGKDLVGYSIFNWAAGEAHLLNLCIHPRWQRKGYGDLMLDHTVHYVARLEVSRLFLEVRESNPAAISLYQKAGFEVIGKRKRYYQAGEEREDAIVMSLEVRSKLIS